VSASSLPTRPTMFERLAAEAMFAALASDRHAVQAHLSMLGDAELLALCTAASELAFQIVAALEERGTA
jgi:hypothetical protein